MHRNVKLWDWNLDVYNILIYMAANFLNDFGIKSIPQKF